MSGGDEPRAAEQVASGAGLPEHCPWRCGTKRVQHQPAGGDAKKTGLFLVQSTPSTSWKAYLVHINDSPRLKFGLTEERPPPKKYSIFTILDIDGSTASEIESN